jgi:hypothetical protein
MPALARVVGGEVEAEQLSIFEALIDRADAAMPTVPGLHGAEAAQEPLPGLDA